MNNSKGKNQLHSQKVGQFDRTTFKQTAEKLFDKAFGYERELKETFKYVNTMNDPEALLRGHSFREKRISFFRVILKKPSGTSPGLK